LTGEYRLRVYSLEAYGSKYRQDKLHCGNIRWSKGSGERFKRSLAERVRHWYFIAKTGSDVEVMKGIVMV
jgi:hypothetical protein